MAKTYFHKLAFNAPIKFKDAYIKFEPVGGNAGVKVLDGDNREQIDELVFLNQLADAKSRGVSRISEAIYIEKKNNRASGTSKSRQDAFGSVRILEPRDSSPIKSQAIPSATAQAVPPVATSAASNQVPAATSKIPVVPESVGQSDFTPAVRKRAASGVFE